MMKRYVLGLVLIILFQASGGQNIIRVKEKIKGSMVDVDSIESKFIDINSRLNVTIDKKKLIIKTGRTTGVSEELMQEIEVLNFVLEDQIEILKILNQNIKGASQANKIERLGKYSELMDEFYNRVSDTNNPELYEKAESILNTYMDLKRKKLLDRIKYPRHEIYILNKMSEYADDTQLKVVESDDFQKLSFQLIAFINTKTDYQRKVHIENFDNYAAGEFYEVDRWVTGFSAEDKAEFKKTQDLANQLNELLDKDLNDLNELLNSQLRSITCIKSLIIDLQDLYNNRDSLFDQNQIKEGEAFVSELKTEFNSFYSIISKISSFNVQTPKSDSKLDNFNDFQNKLIDAATTFPLKIDKLFSDNSGKLENMPEEIDSLRTKINQCAGLLSKDVETVKGIAKFASEIMAPFKNTAKVADEIGGKALEFSLDNFPEIGYIDLKTTGKRKNGDELEIKIKLKTEEDKAKNLPGETLEMRTFTLQQIKVYSITKVTLILAIPPASSNVELLEKNNVQFSPSGSLLFKFGSRKSKAWNFISIGAGFNISTPDFDLNGSPDVALGAIVTVLKDIVSFGYSYNTTTNTPFWFVGLSIPVTLPGIPINNVDSKKID